MERSACSSARAEFDSGKLDVPNQAGAKNMLSIVPCRQKTIESLEVLRAYGHFATRRLASLTRLPATPANDCGRCRLNRPEPLQPELHPTRNPLGLKCLLDGRSLASKDSV